MSQTTATNTNKGPQCPFCEGYCMVNSSNGKAFPTCFKCRSKCPNFKTSGMYRPRYTNKEAAERLRKTCPQCFFGDSYKSKDDRVSTKTPKKDSTSAKEAEE